MAPAATSQPSTSHNGGAVGVCLSGSFTCAEVGSRQWSNHTVHDTSFVIGDTLGALVVPGNLRPQFTLKNYGIALIQELVRGAHDTGDI